MKTRILASLMLIPFFICVYFGGVALDIFLLVLALIGVDEFYKALQNAGNKPSKIIGFTFVLLLALIHILCNGFSGTYIMLWMIALLMTSLVYGFKMDEISVLDSFGTFFGVMYVAMLFYQLVLIDCSEHSIYIWLVFLTAFGTDTMAYFSGYFLGKHKLCPKLSPKKTIEGAIGGILGSIIFNLIFCLLVIKEYNVYIFLFSVVGSVISQIGDLAASSIKRKVGIKDYGKLMPGHGGVLDRFDSVLFVAPILYLFIQFM